MILTILIIVCACVMAFALYKIISVQANYHKAQNEYEALREFTEVVGDASDPDEDAASSAQSEGGAGSGNQAAGDAAGNDKDASSPEKKTVKAPIKVDHASLLDINSDYAAWLYIGALDISYPIMRGPDDEYYLHRTFNQDYLFAGSLFINSVSSKDFSDPNTIIYGHNMKDTSMFGELRLLYDYERYRDDPYFWVLTPENNYRYKIFSMYQCRGDSDTYTLFSGPGVAVSDYIRKMKSQSYLDLGDISINEDSRVVTLSTCVYESGPDRFVVQGILDQP